jgi:hypothetical protein
MERRASPTAPPFQLPPQTETAAVRPFLSEFDLYFIHLSV